MNLFKYPGLLFRFCFVVLVVSLMRCSNTTAVPRTSNAIIEENKKEGTTNWLISVPFDTCSYPNHRFCRRKQVEGYCSHTSISAGEPL